MKPSIKRLSLIEEMKYMNLYKKNAGQSVYKDDDMDYARKGNRVCSRS